MKNKSKEDARMLFNKRRYEMLFNELKYGVDKCTMLTLSSKEVIFLLDDVAIYCYIDYDTKKGYSVSAFTIDIKEVENCLKK